MQTILVPCDGSANALRAVRYAANLAKRCPNTQLELLYVEDPVRMHQFTHLSADQQKEIKEKDADRVLQEARQMLMSEGVAYHEFIRTGAAASEISLHACEAGCESIIMGTRGMSPIASVLIGSVATYTVHLSHVPVTLVK